MEEYNVESVAAIRAQLYDAGFRPVPVLNHDHADPKLAGKAPIGRDWGNKARQDPPDCLRYPPVPHALNTGILTDGLRAIDIDVDDAEIAARCRSIVAQQLGEAPIRMRRNSPRCLMLYRAATGTPSKIVVAGDAGKVEVLGRGQQFVAFGRHPSGASLEWFPNAPGSEPLDALPAITEEALFDVLDQIAPLIGATSTTRHNGEDHSSSDPQADPLRIAAALNVIPNNSHADWEHWNRVGMAIWRSTGGSEIGREAWHAWSGRNASYSYQETEGRWRHYFTSPPTEIGAGTLFRMAQESPPPAPAKPEAAPTFAATPLDWDAMEAVAPREWVYGHFLIRRFISVLGAPGGAGKTAYSFSIALSIVTNIELLREKVHETGNVWIYNLEDPKEELLRRFRASCLHHGISRSQVEERVFIDSGRDRPLVVATVTRDGTAVASPIVDAVIAEIKARDIKVMIVDPFVRSHRLEENVNEQIDFAAALWGQVADKAQCSVLLLHHFRKGGLSGDASAFRGASALIDAARAALSLAPMSEDEAKRLGVDIDDRWQYIRVDNAKLNLAPPPESTVWLRLVGEDIDNAANGRPSDRVQAVERWEPPSAWDGMPWSMVIRILDKIAAGPSDGEFYSLSPQAKERWAGTVLIEDACKTDAQAKVILKAWKTNGVLEEDEYNSPKHKGKATGCVRVNHAKVQEMKQAIHSPDMADD